VWAAGRPYESGGIVDGLAGFNLPQRLSGTVPTWLTEIAVAVAATALFVGLRLLAQPFLGDLAPFSLAILALVLSDLLAGWRSGAVSLVLGLGLIWYFVIPPQMSFGIVSSEAGLSLALTAAVELAILIVLALYQREVRATEEQRATRISFLGDALREMDHRTKNNFQIVTGLLTLQASRSGSAEVKAALGEAVERLQAVSAVYDALAPSSAGLASVRLQDQLEEICGQIRRGILPQGIALEAELEPIVVPHETAVAIGIVVNELVTNACKHAFGDGGGEVRVRVAREDGGARIEVADNGCGYASSGRKRTGLGTRLIASFVDRVGGRSEVRSTAEGTVHTILVPLR
jgi:two-component sensor histidine kinase